MRIPHRLVSVLVCGASLLSVWCAFAQDWPQWRGPQRDGKVVEFSVPTAWPPTLTQVWSVSVGKGAASPALVGDRLYLFTRQGEEEVALYLNVTDGSQIWRNSYAAAAPTGPAGRQSGPRSSPAVAEGRIFTLGVRGVVSCLNADTGEVLWRRSPLGEAVPQFYTAMSPLILEDTAIVHLGSETNGALLALDLTTGAEKWRWDGAGPQYASPVVLSVDGVGQIVTLTAAGVVGVSAADGALLWEIPFQPRDRAYNIATPLVEGQTVIYTGAGRGTHAVRIVPGEAGFAVEQLWSNPDVAVQFNTPVLENGLLLGITSGGNLFCLDAQTGATKWVCEQALGRGGFGAVVSSGRALFALSTDGVLIAFAPSGDAYTELGRMTIADTPTYAHPVLSGNRIFVKGEDTLTLWVVQ